MKSSEKRIYHPMFIALFMENVLDKTLVSQIPKSTRHQWRQTNQTDMFGFEHISNYAGNLASVKEIFEVAFLQKSSIAICKIYRCFRKIINEFKGYKNAFNKHAYSIVKTIDYLISVSNINTACRLFNISTQKFYRLKNKLYCSASVNNLCYKLHPQQLTLKEVENIRHFLNRPEYSSVPLSTVYYSILNAGKSFFCSRTFYKYCSLIGEKRKLIKTKKIHKRFRARRLFEYIHIDINNVHTLQKGVCKVAFVKDNVSKACLHSEVLMDGTSFAITNLLKNAFEKHTLYSFNGPVNIVCDGGPENNGDFDQWISNLKHPSTIKLTAQTETFPFSNNMSESIHHIFKNIFLRDYIVYDRASLVLKIKDFAFFYGHVLYPLELYGFTTQQVLNGAIPDKHRFALQIKNSQKMRAIENHATDYCKGCFPKAE